MSAARNPYPARPFRRTRTRIFECEDRSKYGGGPERNGRRESRDGAVDRSRITTSWSRILTISAIAAFLLHIMAVLSTWARPISRPSGGQNQKDIILLKIVIACGYFDCPLGIARVCRRFRGCHCLGRVLRSAKQHDLYEAAAYTHVTMGFWGKLAFRSVWALAADSQGQITLIIQNVVGCSLQCRASHSNATGRSCRRCPVKRLTHCKEECLSAPRVPQGFWRALAVTCFSLPPNIHFA